VVGQALYRTQAAAAAGSFEGRNAHPDRPVPEGAGADAFGI